MKAADARRAECLIEFREGSKDPLKIEVKAPTIGSLPKRLDRSLPPVSDDDLDDVRRGPTADLLAKLQSAISRWLMHPDLDLGDVLRLYVGEQWRWRIAFSFVPIEDRPLLSRLSALPYELITEKDSGDPLVLHNRVSSFVHLLPKMGDVPPVTADWPLRILILRPMPRDLPKVPPANALRDHILGLYPVADSGGSVEVDILSREDGALGKPTREGLSELLKKRSYDILVYLGHGDVRKYGGANPVSYIQLEKPSKDEEVPHSDPMDAGRLSSLLHSYPVPVVLLTGCLTAAEAREEDDEELERLVPRWVRGNEGAAQALINGSSGVRIAVGMRCRIDGADAVFFLEEFFSALLADSNDEDRVRTVGDVERSVQSARRELHIHANDLSGLASPVMFRGAGQEPTFPFLREPPHPSAPPLSDRDQLYRKLTWKDFASRPVGEGQSSRVRREVLRAALQELEGKYKRETASRAGLLMPQLTVVEPPRLIEAPRTVEAAVPVELTGKLTVGELRGTLAESGASVRFLELRPSDALGEAGFLLYVSTAEPHRVRFILEHESRQPARLPEGVLFDALVEVKARAGVYYYVEIEDLGTDPRRPLARMNNALILPPP